ncbi:MAG: hypothetical protein ACRCST_17735, partial [Turicibacter sp.]
MRKMKSLLKMKDSGLISIAHLNQEQVIAATERVLQFPDPVPTKHMCFRKFDEIENLLENAVKNLFRQLKGLQRTCDQVEQSDSTGDVLKVMLSQFFIDRLEENELKSLREQATHLQAGVQAAKRRVAASLVNELEFIVENYDIVLAIRLVAECFENRVEITTEIKISILNYVMSLKNL